MDRAERRRQERAARKNVVIGDGIVASGNGQFYEATGHGTLPDKVPGQHRWIAAASYYLPTDSLADVSSDNPKFLDNENLFFLGIGCWDCEQTLAETGGAHSHCPAKVV